MSSPRPLEISTTYHLIKYTWADLFSSVQIHSVKVCLAVFLICHSNSFFNPGCSVSVANNSFVLPCGRGACISKHFPLSNGDWLLARAVSISSQSKRKYLI